MFNQLHVTNYHFSGQKLNLNIRQIITDALIRHGESMCLPIEVEWNLNDTQQFPCTRMNVKISSAKWRPFCLGPNVLTHLPTSAAYMRQWIDQSHRYGRHQAACRDPAGSYDKTTRTAICFEHKTQYLLISALYACIVIFWHISNIPPMISQSQISCNTCYIASIFVKYCYITGNWLL